MPVATKGRKAAAAKNPLENCFAEVTIGYRPDVKFHGRELRGPNDAYLAARAIFDDDRIGYVESFYILLLNRANKVIGYSKISEGGCSGTVVDAKVVFTAALLGAAAAIVLTHNHPSGNTAPSQADIDITKKLVQAGTLLDIPILDHIIVTPFEGSYTSMKNEGFM